MCMLTVWSFRLEAATATAARRMVPVQCKLKLFATLLLLWERTSTYLNFRGSSLSSRISFLFPFSNFLLFALRYFKHTPNFIWSQLRIWKRNYAKYEDNLCKTFLKLRFRTVYFFPTTKGVSVASKPQARPLGRPQAGRKQGRSEILMILLWQLQ